MQCTITRGLLSKRTTNRCSFSVNTCTVQTVSNATPVPSGTIDYNSEVIYTCEYGYSHTAGNLTLSCQANGSLTGSTPVCTSKLQ